MHKNWVEIESIFRSLGIYFELQDWLYFCLIEGRYFYYSPQTGKWRIKGKGLWLTSNSLLDFIAQAKVYSPPDSKSRTSERQSSKKKSAKKQKSSSNKKKKSQKKTQSKSYSYNYQNSGQGCDGIRPEFLSVFGEYLEKQRERGYKIGWIWYKLIEECIPSKLEICWLSVVFDYSDGWAFHKIREVHGYAEPGSVSATIKKYKLEWLSYFEQRWGVSEQQEKQQEYKEHKQYKERRKYQEQKTSDSRQRQHRSTASTFAHQAYLQLLGLTLPFTMKELKSAYRRMALQVHPDAGGSAEAFRQVHHAYQTLSVYGGR